MEQIDIIIFLGSCTALILVAFILSKVRDSFWIPLIMLTVALVASACFLLNLENPMDYTNLNDGNVMSWLGVMLTFGLLVGISTSTLFSLCTEHELETGIDDNLMKAIPYVAILLVILLVLNRYDTIPLTWVWYFLSTCTLAATLWIVLGDLHFDLNSESVYSVGLISISLFAYIVAMPIICDHILIVLIGGGIFIYAMKREYVFSGLSSVSIPSKDTHTSSRESADRCTRTVTIKGVYQLNGPKPFIRVIECDKSETGYYSQLINNKARQAQWIQANYPGADTSRGFSMTVNIK